MFFQVCHNPCRGFLRHADGADLFLVCELGRFAAIMIAQEGVDFSQSVSLQDVSEALLVKKKQLRDLENENSLVNEEYTFALPCSYVKRPVCLERVTLAFCEEDTKINHNRSIPYEE